MVSCLTNRTEHKEQCAVNDKMCRMYGLTKEESLKVSIKDVSSPKMAIETLQEKSTTPA